MIKKKAVEPSAFVTSGGAAAAPAKASTSLKPKVSRSRKTTPKAETSVLAPAVEVALPTDTQVESTTRTSKLETPRAKSTAVTHRHKKLEIAMVELNVAEPETRAFVEPANEQIAAQAYSYYVARGYQPGNQADDWFRAVAELRAKLNP